MVLHNLSLNRALLYARTIRHLRLRQILWRLRSRRARAKIPVAPTTPPEWDIEGLDRLREHLAAKADLLGTRHAEPPKHAVFLNQAAPLDYGTPWNDTMRPLLWHYHLHAFRHMDPLISPGNAHGAALLDEIHDWIRYNPPGSRPGWDPYPLSCRLIRWVCVEACHRFGDAEMQRSAHQQTRYLVKNVEYGVDGNHLLKNAAALAVYGAVADAALLKQGMRLLKVELNAQILPDGMHYERSPMYHALALEDLLTVAAVLAKVPDFLRDAIGRMCNALEVLCHPDGDIALFGDSVLGEAMPARALLHFAGGGDRASLETFGHTTCGVGDPRTAHGVGDPRRAPSRSGEPMLDGALPDAGFHVLSPPDTGHHFIAKAGWPGPAHQLGHAHSDPMSYELSVSGLRIVVDSGTHGYAESPFREYCRSVRAHNTVCVNGHEPLECWDTFRVARRYQHVSALCDPYGVRSTCQGYQGFLHARVIVWRGEGGWHITDKIIDTGPLSVVSYLHFHPECRVRPGDDERHWLVNREGVFLEVRLLCAMDAELIMGCDDPPQGWYCPRFGEALPAPTLVFHASGTGTCLLKYAIVPSPFEYARVPAYPHPRTSADSACLDIAM